MSSTLVYRPIKSYEGNLPDELKFSLLNRFDGIIENVSVDEDFIPYLEGLKDGGVKGADKLIKLIKKHGEIELNEAY